MSITAERLAAWARGEPAAPVRIELHVTNRCNLRCLFCWQIHADRGLAPAEIHHDKAVEIVEDAGRIGVREWIISGGGEPLVRKKTVAEVFRRIKRHEMWGQLTTNGVLFTPDLIQEMVDLGWDQVQFSIDAPDAATHNFLRNGPDAFEKATRHLELFSNEKARRGATAPYIGINCILTNRIHRRLPEMISLAHDIGCQLVFFEPIYSGYLSDVTLDIPRDERPAMQESIEEALHLADRLGIATNIANFRETGLVEKNDFHSVVLGRVADFSATFLNAPCFQPWYLMGIKGNGLAGCCSTFTTGEFIHDKSLEEIWFGEVFNKTRRDMIRRCLPECCAKCSVVVVLDNEKLRREVWELMEADRKAPAPSEDDVVEVESERPVDETNSKFMAAEVRRLDAQLVRLEAVLGERKRVLAQRGAEHQVMENLRAGWLYKLYRLLKGF
ncbi:radical SAM protein [bacterium]|nr:radical SAM protein [candidate division CSSED10-310 bacterium]